MNRNGHTVNCCASWNPSTGIRSPRMDIPLSSRGAGRELLRPTPSRSWLGGSKSARKPGTPSPTRSADKEDNAPNDS
eukprot:2446989-Pyramimonas_sp.AAC.1